ncbi:hypothetical protein KIH74_03065 [Kineosporia sp. J2-2]|uniref:Secreted protein n=1 Tax=Kineosporia corallincola TaxID=2835133 RepID=A0ABS5TA08_9ACTN|nr:hypothetical protein [Kineosporia corallincola]MBT0767886.1 hypothetical protein [Kineosporia corallincola]
MKTGQTDEQGLPDELVQRMRRLAETGTAGSRPFPRVETAIRRSRVTRYGGVALAGAVAAVVIGVEVLAGGAIDRADQQGTPATPQVTATATKEPSTPEEAGYPERTVGSLAGDDAWLGDLREEFSGNDDWHDPDEPAIAADDVRVVAAGDVDGRARYAMVLFSWQKKGRTYWDRSFLLGRAGAAATDLDVVSYQGLPEGPGQVPHDPYTLFVSPSSATDRSSNLDQAVVLVVAPQADQVRITSGRTFAVENGAEKITDRYEAVPKIGDGFWAGPVTEDEYLLSTVQIEAGGTRLDSNSMSTAPGYDLAAVAATGTDAAALEDLGGSLGGRRASTAEVPVWAGALDVGKKGGHASAALLRSADGVYLAAFADVVPATDVLDDEDGETMGEDIKRGHMVTTADGDGEAMAGVYVNSGKTRRYLVIAPEDATRVRVGDVTAKVENRLAVVTVPQSVTDDGKPAEAEALSSDGSVVTSITAPEAQESDLLDTRDANPDADATSVGL